MTSKMSGYFYNFVIISFMIELIHNIFINFLFCKEIHSSDLDYVVTEQVMEYIKENMFSTEAVKYSYNHTIFPNGKIIGRWFVADVVINPMKNSPNCKDINIWFFRFFKKPCWSKDIRNDADDICSNDSENVDCENVNKYETISKTSDEICSRYMIERNCVYLDNDHDKNTWQFAMRFASMVPKSDKCIVLFGEPGLGKTTIAKAMAVYNDARLVKINPTSAGLNLQNALYIDDKPIIVLFDDVDKSLKLIHENKIGQCQRDFIRRVYDKCTWNTLLDELKDKSNVTVVMTMNSVPLWEGVDKKCKNKKGDRLDICKSMLRRGRVSNMYEIMNGERWICRDPVGVC